MNLRKAKPGDLAAVEIVETQATPKLKYLPSVFGEFVSDQKGEFIVGEVDGEIVACGKFTVLPDGSAWLETLRVMPKAQGKGLGKAFYRRFFEIAKREGIDTMRMYTGVKNRVSKGLAERNGFNLAATYRGVWKAVGPEVAPPRARFSIVTDPERATDLLMPLKDKWTGFVVMNRTFYELTPALCEAWAREGKVYEEPASGSVVALGARFMPEQAVHVAAFAGDEALCLEFAEHLAVERGADKVQCMFPPSDSGIREFLIGRGFALEESDCIVMQVRGLRAPKP